jgi:predicted KAP-like P-loop ATPase
MWPDNETERDFVNFTGIADTVAEIIVQANGRPISIGVSGSWGAGKTSMISLAKSSLRRRAGSPKPDFVFVEFNAWLYQGYDDARAAFIEVVAEKLHEEANKRQKAISKALSLLGRVRWLRVAKYGVVSAVAVKLGLLPVGLLGGLANLALKAGDGSATEEELGAFEGAADKAAEAAAGMVKPSEQPSPPKQIHALRENFEELVSEMGVTLVVLVDDLDRCLPETTISTLEAMRLFLFMKGTAFVIAADDDVIRHAVRRHFDGGERASDDRRLDEKLVTSYFDKLIQVPIRVPSLGTQEVRAYMMLLFIENSTLSDADKEKIRAAVCDRLRKTWQGARVDRAFISSLDVGLNGEILNKLDAAERLAPIMATASGIAGNPRLVKRFLNALSLRMASAKAQGVDVDEALLAKLLLFERVGNPVAYAQLTAAVMASETGKPEFLAVMETKAQAGEDQKLSAPWDGSFALEWLALAPPLAQRDLRGALYVSREHTPMIMPGDRLSSEAAELLALLLKAPDMARGIALKDRLRKVERSDMNVIMDRLLERARQEQEWGVPPILEACLSVAECDPSQGARVAAFLRARPTSQIKPNIVPKIADQPWCKEVFDAWSDDDVSTPVKNAIKVGRKNGNVAV